jgi:hypothetical protein
MNTVSGLQLVRVLALLCWALLVRPALAQDLPSPAAEVELQVERFGPGSVCRQGEWVGLYVSLNDRALEQREIILRLQGRDADGDRPMYDTVVASNPGTRQAFWVYTRLPFRFDQSETLQLSAWEALPAGDDDAQGSLAYRASRLLGSTAARPVRVLDRTESMIGVFGSWHFGLGAYGVALQGGGIQVAPTGHELTRIITGLEHAEVPHRYQGLLQFDALVWGGARRGADPLYLSTDQANAIREWVRRGGHLIVTLPSVGQEWFSGANPLRDLLPASMPGRLIEGYDLNRISALLSRDAETTLPTEVALRVFEADEDASCILATPEGECIVARRAVGAGAVTVIGIDLSNAALVSLGLPHPDQFWHRILGRRGTLDPDSGEAKRAINSQRTRVSFDSDIPDEIAKSGRAYVGVLLGFVVFALYWILAGPGGFGLLARWKIKHHAWVAFVAAIALFTAIAWTGATLLRPKRVEAVHLTFLHQVAGQASQRARTWASVLIPSYGDATISVGDPDSDALLSPWEPPVTDVLTQSSFPDNRAYRVDARRPNAMRVPTRSTIKQIRVDWTGEPIWTGISALRDPGQIGETLVHFNQAGHLVGRLTHDLPGPLEDVVLIVVHRQQNIPRRGIPLPQVATIAVADAYRLTGDWAPGEANAISLETITSNQTGKDALTSFLEVLITKGTRVTADLGPRDAGTVSERLTAALLFPQLPPPTYNRMGAQARLAQRSETHGLDLGLWMTQPCVIVIGHLRESQAEGLPLPLRVNGRDVRSGGGRTVVSWVYPLGDSAPEFQPELDELDTDEGSGDASP